MARQGGADRGLYTRTLKNGTVVWGVRLSIRGRMKKFSPFRTKGDARAFYEKARTQQREARFFPERFSVVALPVQTVIERYLLTVHHKATGHQERVFADWWGRWYAKRPVTAITAQDLEAARKALREGQWGQRPRTLARVNRYTQWLHQVCAHPVNREQLPRNPVDVIKKYPEKRPPRVTLSHVQQAALVRRLEQETPGVTDWVTIAAVCGLRQGEQFSRRKADVDVGLWAFVIPNAKHQDEPKIIFIPPSARPAVRRQLKTPGPWLFPDPRNAECPVPIQRWYKTKFRRAVNALGLQCNWHSLRHTFASRMLLTGASTKTVAKAGGWSSEKMVSEVYGHLTDHFIVEAMERAATVPGTAPRGRRHTR